MTRSLSLLLLGLLTVPALAAAQISDHEFQQRREAFMASDAGGVAVAVGNARTRGAHLPFAYLTGYAPTNALLVMVREGETVRATLFRDPGDPLPERLDGTRPEGPPEHLAVRPLAELDDLLDPLLTRHESLTVAGSPTLEAGDGQSAVEAALARTLARHPGVEPASGNSRVNELRAVKSPAELELIERAVEITVAAHRAILRTLEPGIREAELQAVIDSVFAAEGGDARPAFGHIVASGPNSTILHYRGGARTIADGEHVKIDIGAAYHGYAADVTRTYPANGRFSPEQRAIYQVVRDAQAAAESLSETGTRRARHSEVADSVLSHGLAELGLIEAPDATYDCPRGQEERRCPQLRLFYFHSLGHGIGLNVHDPTTPTIEPGTAMSIEPGIYVRPELLETLADTPDNQRMIEAIRPAFDRFVGIGVRIEDDYILTDAAEGLRWISPAPREIDEIEAAIRTARGGG